MEEKEIWKGRPSQWTNFGVYLICVLLSWLIIPIFIALWKFLVVKTWKITTTTDELELYRVKDIRFEQPFWLRLVGLSNIVMSTFDKTHATVIVPAIKNGKELREKLRIAVDERRDVKRVRETDFI
ncbi:PH domain-containing protein [Vicingaceae bacterium]|nr:PH domain-containing protein [Vicingaceae bacterium]